MLRIIRIIIAIVSFMAMTVLFVDFTGSAAAWLSFLPKVQLVPAIIALNFVAIAVVLCLTLLFGRLYCSVLCPLGIFQDIIGRIKSWLSPKKKRRIGLFHTTAELSTLRYLFFGLFAVLFILGLTGVLAMSYAGFLDPYSIFGRFAGQTLSPAWRAAIPLGNAAADHGIWLFSGYPAPSAFSWVLASVATAQLVIVGALAWWRGRIYCNTVCPVGTALGYVSKYSLFKVTINMDKCITCGKCARKCKSGCIDSKNHSIDHSRCVACMDCLDACSEGALSFRISRPSHHGARTTDAGRRAFLATAGIVGGTLAAEAADKLSDGGFAPVKKKKAYTDCVHPVPAGAASIRHFALSCTACQLCVSECPSGILRPSLEPGSFMQPRMIFTEGYCLPECTRCADICPAGAIRPIDTATKSVTQIGTATVNPDLCISAAYGQHCGNCARNCPTGAITMVDGENGNQRPTVNAELCIGCGKCEYVCPVGTAGQLSSDVAAIHVIGNEVHIQK